MVFVLGVLGDLDLDLDFDFDFGLDFGPDLVLPDRRCPS
jgi:hypothetical protein